MRYNYLLVLVLASTSLLPIQLAAGQTCGLNYQLLTSSGTLYGLVGMYDFAGLPNQTSVTVTGKLLPYNPSEYIHPTANFGGTILVLLIESSATTQSWYSITVVEEQQSSTWTTTQANNPAPTQQTVTITGMFVTSNGGCVQPLASKSPLTENIAVIAVLMIIGIVIIIMKSRHRK